MDVAFLDLSDCMRRCTTVFQGAILLLQHLCCTAASLWTPGCRCMNQMMSKNLRHINSHEEASKSSMGKIVNHRYYMAIVAAKIPSRTLPKNGHMCDSRMHDPKKLRQGKFRHLSERRKFPHATPPCPAHPRRLLRKASRGQTTVRHRSRSRLQSETQCCSKQKQLISMVA